MDSVSSISDTVSGIRDGTLDEGDDDGLKTVLGISSSLSSGLTEIWALFSSTTSIAISWMKKVSIIVKIEILEG